jgi:cyclic pyranopterin phosphate synthase
MTESRPSKMIDVSAKDRTHRTAVATGRVQVSAGLLDRIRAGGIEKGDPIEIARIAGIAATKRTPEILPLCHPIAVTRAELKIEPADPDHVEFQAHVEGYDRTGVEMEALTAVAAACLCFYDVCKKHDREMVIESIRLERKSGGRSGDYVREAP